MTASTDVADELIELFGLTVRQLREAEGWSQDELAARSLLNRSYVGEIERGRVVASLMTAQKLALAFQLSLAMLLVRCEQTGQRRVVQRINLAAIAS
ncbi:helix-turn-helix transcriptional regulator [Variovorax sp. Sphag1AA]|uniref:helix-turn-helix domain-containing protein n=1 Tax=Variovorax sp. Sphag1AA TaxID=2587027 RepID=UPI00160765F4|nr:helix-turn-helix transcriptional regulator [Variovorax sp. Sphag1AA]MBB3181469.1 transcriptional regulator with XRE-family HTH domain [Variovorax sp. Sphag1AA]